MDNGIVRLGSAQPGLLTVLIEHSTVILAHLILILIDRIKQTLGSLGAARPAHLLGMGHQLHNCDKHNNFV